jgi:hypothetical protein
MASFVPPFCSFLWIALHRIAIRFRDLFGLVVSSLQKRLTVRAKKPEESTVNPTVCVNSPTKQTSTCAVFTINPQPQIDLDILGVGAAGQVYRVDDNIVLKTCRVYEPPRDDASKRERWFYASETLFHFNLMRDERTVLRLFERRPHPNIVEAIDTDRPEGIYLRKYLQLSELDPYVKRTKWKGLTRKSS